MDYYELYHQQQQIVKLRRIVNDIYANNSVDINKNNEIMVYFEKNPPSYVYREFKDLGFFFMDNGTGEGGWFVKTLYKRGVTFKHLAYWFRILFFILFVMSIIAWLVFLQTGISVFGCFIKERFGCRTFTV